MNTSSSRRSNARMATVRGAGVSRARARTAGPAALHREPAALPLRHSNGRHDDGPPYDQLSFRFTGGFPSYDVETVDELTADGTASTVTSAPAPAIGYKALTSYAPAGDFEGVLS